MRCSRMRFFVEGCDMIASGCSPGKGSRCVLRAWDVSGTYLSPGSAADQDFMPGFFQVHVDVSATTGTLHMSFQGYALFGGHNGYGVGQA